MIHNIIRALMCEKVDSKTLAVALFERYPIESLDEGVKHFYKRLSLYMEGQSLNRANIERAILKIQSRDYLYRHPAFPTSNFMGNQSILAYMFFINKDADTLECLFTVCELILGVFRAWTGIQAKMSI
ncbi:MAG: hypothetical protein Q8M40_13470 [Legionella sp.]|nr:hypothetical protein [Legionella sp.]